jgi:hypothetical protein
MSSPTPGSDPNYPQGGAPEGQQGWGAPPPPQQYPAPGYPAAPQGYGAPVAGQRPSTVSAAAITGIVWGGLGTLFGLLALFALSTIFSYSGVLGIFVILGLAASVALLIGGIQALQGKSPKLLLYLSYASIAIQLISLIVSIASGYGFAFGSLLGFIVPIVIVAMLMQPASKQYYAARGMAY